MTDTPAPAVRTRALAALTVANFLMWGGFFMVIPLLSVHYVQGLGWAAATVGTVLAVRQLTQQGLTVFGGALSDRLGPRGLILAGLAVRAVGFAMIGWADTLPLLLAASLLAGVGGSLFDAPKNAAITALTQPEQRARVFGVMGVAGNLGMVIGPLVGAFLNRVDFSVVALVSGGVYLVTLFLILVTLPPLKPSTPEGGLSGLGIVVRDAPFVLFTVLLMGYNAILVQLNVAVTLKATQLHGVTAVSWLYGVNAGLAILLQYPLLRYAERRLPLTRVLVIGVTLTALGLASMAAAHTFAVLIVCLVVFSFGSMLGYPVQQTLTARLARRGLYGAYFGFGALSLGVGGAVGNALGGALYDAAGHLGMPALPWVTFGLVGLLTATGLHVTLRPGRLEAPQEEERAP